jgi:hypothetical protein
MGIDTSAEYSARAGEPLQSERVTFEPLTSLQDGVWRVGFREDDDLGFRVPLWDG